MSSAYELNLEYGLIDPDEDELEGIGTEEERSEALISASLPSITPPSPDTESLLTPPEETTPIVPTGLARTPSIPRAEARIQPIAQPAQARGPIYRTAEAILSPAEQLNREYGLAPTIPSEGIIPREITRPESPATRLNREMGLTQSTRPIGETRETQEPGTPVSTIFKDLMVPIEPVPPPPPEKPGLIGEALRGIPHGILQVGEIAGGLVGLAGEVTGIEAIEKVGVQLHKTFQEMNEKFKPTVAGFQDIESVGDAARYLGHGFMSMLPFMVGTFGVGAAIRGVVTKTLGKAITERAAAKAIIGFSSLAAASTVAETGIISGERIDEGMKALSLNLLWAVPAGLMDALPQWRLLGKLGWFGRSVTKRAEREGLRAARHYFIKEVGKQGFFEGVTESTQEIFEALGAGKKPFSYETLMQAANAFIIAGFTGGIMGGAVTLLGPSPRKKAAPAPAIAPPVAPPDVTRDPTDLLKPAVVAKPDVAGLWKETVFREVEEPILEVEMKKVWDNFLESVKAWPSLDIQNDQVIIKDSKGGQLSFDFDNKQPAGKEFTPRIYTDKNGVSTVLSPDAPLPQSLKDTITPEVSKYTIGQEITVEGKVGQVAEIDIDGTVRVGFRDGTIREIEPEERVEGIEISFEKAVDIVRKMPRNLMDGWFRNADRNYKRPLVGLINEDPDIKSAGLKIMHHQYEAFTGQKIPYNEFVNREITLYRGGNITEDAFTSYTMDKSIAAKWGKVAEIKIKPRDTLGSYQTIAETEVLVPRSEEARGAGVTAAPTPPGAGLVPAATPFIEGAKIDLLRKEVVEPALEPVREVLVAPAVPPVLPKGFFEALIMFDENGAVSVRPFSHEGAENIPGFLGKVIIDAKKDTIYTPEMMMAKNAGEAINGIARLKVEALNAEGFRPAFQDLLPGDRFRARIGGDGSLREWFGNSKVVDANGNPLTLYRGGAEGGKFFTDSLAAAKRYGKQITSVFLRMENPKIIDYKGASDKDLYSLDMPEAKGEGYDGIIAKNVDDGYQILDQYVVFDSKQVRPTEGIEGAARSVVPPFYHLSEVIINSKMTGPMSSTQILKMLQNAGVKQDELISTGLDDLLKQPKKFTKQEVLDYIRQNEVRVVDVTKGGLSPAQLADWDKLFPKVSQDILLTTEEATRYQELLKYRHEPVKFGPETYPSFNLPGGTQYEEKFLTLPNVEDFSWKDGHGAYVDIKNPIVRLRLDRRVDANGRKGLFFQEIQPPRPEEQAKMPGWVVKRWREISIKEMFRMGAEENVEWIGWTTGEQQVVRYDLGKYITSLFYRPVSNGYELSANIVGGGTHNFGYVAKEKLSGIIGKGLSGKIIAGEGKQSGGIEGTKYFSDLDLKVGGEGLKRIYDEDFPNVANSLGKKWGVRVGEIQIPGREIWKTKPSDITQTPELEIGMETVHSLPITPSMKESVLFEGQPLFREAMQKMEGPPMSVMAVQKVIDTFQVQLPTDVLSYDVPSSVDELPADIRKRNKVTGKTQALYDRVLNKVYIIADRHTSEQDVLTSMSHELFAHFGFERLFGPARMNEIVQEVHKFYGKGGLAYLYQAYNKIPGSPDGDYTVAIEKIAEFAGTGENPGLWKRFVYWFRYHATKLFGPIRFSEDDIRAYLWRSRILIQQQSFQDQVRKYNAFVKLTGAKMWDNGLPIGPLGARFAMREDTSPSHENAAENFTGWRGWYEAYSNKDKNFGNEIFKRLGLVESVASLPHWIGMNHPSFKPTTQVQWDRMDEKNRDRLYLLQDPGTNQGSNPYMSVDLLKDTSGVDPLIVWSDRENIYLESDENLQRKAIELIRRNLTPVEIKAYRGWKDGFDRAVGYAIARLRQLSVDFYSSATWFDQLKGVLDGTVPMDQVQLEGSDAKDFQRALKKVAERMQTIDEQEVALKKLNFYAPHVRGRGDHIVRVYDVDPEGKDVAIWVERFDSATQAERARMRLGSQYRDLRVVKTLEKQTSEFIYGGLNVYAMEAFLKKSAERAIKEGKINEAEADALLNAVFKSMSDEIMARGFRQHYIRRQQGNIGGYREENLRQVFLDYMSGLAGSMAKLDATRKFHDALQSIDKVNESETYEYASRYATDMLRNRDSLDNKLNALKTIPYLWYISMNLRLAATQMFQNGITAYPILSRIMQDLGVEGHASTELAKAMVDLRGNMTVQEQTMLQNAYNDGETMAQFIQEIKGDISRSWAGKYFTKFVDLVSLPFTGMERFNRKSSLLAAFRVALRAGQTETEAYETAKEFVRSAHYAYGLNNFPQLLRDGTPFSKIAGLGYVFKSFPHNYVLSMIHYTKGKDGKLALGVLMRSLAALTILGGLGAAPFIDDLLDELERQTNYPARTVIRKSLEKVGGPLLASAGMEGILALVGLDMSGSTKIQIPIPGVGEYDPGTIMMGVYGGLIDKGKNAISFAANNQWMRAVESAMPAGVESAIKSHRLATEGLRTATGKPILDIKGKLIKAGPLEVAAGLAGFRPARIAGIQKERRVAQNIKDAYAAKRKKIIRRMRLATTPEERRELSKDIQSYNLSVMKYGKFIPKIERQSIKQAMQPERGYMEYERLFED